MNIAIILAGGIGSRMRSDGFPKQYIEVLDKPVLVYTLEKFEQSTDVDKIVIVANSLWYSQIVEWLKKYRISKFYDFALQGESRQESILNGLKIAVQCNASDDDKVIIHDSVRPLVSQELISKCFKELDDHDGCMPVITVNDTIYFSNNGKSITELLDRSKLYAGQSPESFNLKKYFQINTSADKTVLENTKGSSEIAFNNGFDISLIPGDNMNFKLTTPEDLARFQVILKGEK